MKLRALFANPDELLYPNQFVNARLLVNTLQDTVRVPVPAVQRGEPGTFVYVINANNTVSVRPVKLGPTDGGYAAVLSGLQPGDRVVTDGTDRLRDGATVTVPPPGPNRPLEAAGRVSAQRAGRKVRARGQPAAPGQAATPGQPAPPDRLLRRLSPLPQVRSRQPLRPQLLRPRPHRPLRVRPAHRVRLPRRISRPISPHSVSMASAASLRRNDPRPQV